MSRRCELTGKRVMAGNNVSHALNRTRRRFLPNIQETGVWSEALGKFVRLKVAVSTIRTIEHKGGLDAFLLNSRAAKLTPEAAKLRARVQKAIAAKQASA